MLPLIPPPACAPIVAVQDEVVPHNQERPPGPPLSPSEALARMRVPDGFSVELVASEPELRNPVAMCFDERGRVWVTTSDEYPRREPGPGRDRILVLEDTDGDGAADRSTVFADDLNIPSGIAVGHGGVWVANAPDLLLLRDSDGDGRADEREVVVTGFGREDVHEVPNSLTWGPDGWLYGLNGVFNPARVQQGERTFEFTAAVFRVHPRTREFQVFCEGTSNPWGIAFDPAGSAFLSACVIDHMWHVVETGVYERQAGAYPPYSWWAGSIADHAHQKAAYCGLWWFDSPAYPERYRERLYLGNIHGGCINVDRLAQRGASYVASGEEDFLTADDAWFMPVSVQTGPDGCLWVLDWYDRYHCYQDANRDPGGIHRASGRLYRVRYGDAPRRVGFDLGGADDADLVARLAHASDWDRRTAQRLLAERACAPDAAATRTALAHAALDAGASREARLRATGALSIAGALAPDLTRALLEDGDPAVRAFAARVAGDAGGLDDATRARLAELAQDVAPEVRLQVAIAAPKVAGPDAAAWLARVAERAGDDGLLARIAWRNLEPLLARDPRAAAAALIRSSLAEVPAGVELLPRAVERLLAAPRADGAELAAAAALCHRAGPTGAVAEGCLGAVARALRTGELQGERSAALHAALAATLDACLADAEQAPRAALVLAASRGDERARGALRALVLDRVRPAGERADAFDALASSGAPELLALAAGLLAERGADLGELRARAVEALARLDAPEVSDVLLASFSDQDAALRKRIVALLAGRATWTLSLLDAVGDGRVPRAEVSAPLVLQLLERGDEELAARVRACWGDLRAARDPAREHVVARMRRLVRSRPGDPLAGERAFDRVCAHCHRIYDHGADLGPDLTSNGRASFDQLLSNVFDPNQTVGAAYRGVVLRTVDGRILTGLVAEEGEARVVLKVEGGGREVVPRDEIDVLVTSELSFMPVGLELALSEDEVVDLFAFLTLDRHPRDPLAQRLAGSSAIEPRETLDPAAFDALVAEVAPGFTLAASGDDGVALLADHAGRPIVVRTHPLSRAEPCVLRGRFALPADRPARLALAVAHHARGDWRLVVRVAGQVVLDVPVTGEADGTGWLERTLDLGAHAGQTVDIVAENHATDWNNEYGYWARLEVLAD